MKIAKSAEDSPSQLVDMGNAGLCHWLSKYIVEIRRNNGKPYTSNTLHQILCGVQRYLREETGSSVDFFSDSDFRFLKSVLDKELCSQGVGTKKK